MVRPKPDTTANRETDTHGLFLGVLSVNAHEYAPEAVLPKALWIFLTMVCAVAVWVSAPVGLGLLAFMGIMKIQESRTNWCPSDPVFKSLGIKKRTAS